MADWQTLSSDIVYETPWMKVRRDEVLNHNGTPLTYSYIEMQRPSVFIVAMNANGDIFLQRSYRYTLGQTMWEIPAGFADDDDLLANAQRELAEETGLASDDWTELGTFYQANGIGNIPFTVFLARDVHATDAERDKDEELTDQGFVSLDNIKTMIADGEFVESAHITAIYCTILHLKEDK